MKFDSVVSTLEETFGDKLNCIKSDAEYLEILPENASKGLALEIIAQSLGIPMAEVIAAGDHFNDISMIKAAGLGVAVQNAEPEVLDAADYITASNDEDGVADVIEKVIAGLL
jgi:Cof subfamily protein (haloacid dehalogenase superfamily)